MRRVHFRGYCAKTDCGKPVFSRFQKTKYCSVECAKGRFGDRGSCANCEETLNRRRKKYCSVECAKGRFVDRGSCANCEETLNRRRKKYCSVRCQHLAYFKARCAAFEAGLY